MLENYEFFHIPPACEVNKTIFKKLFYENADLSSSDKVLFTDVINKITWLYCMKPETINIQPYQDETREYLEIEFLEVELAEERKLSRIAELMMRTIPYPMVLVFRFDNQWKLFVAHQRNRLNDSSKITIEEFISTGWIDNGSELLGKLDVRTMRFSNFFDLYSDIVDVISIYNAETLIGSDLDLSGEAARKLSSTMEGLDNEITSLKSMLKNETQFNRQIELNIQIKELRKRKSQLMGGK